jgi:hypothetical protein
MNVLLIISAIAIIATKFADCYTTDVKITQETINFERNKIGRWLFSKFGARKAIWATWIVAIAISVVAVVDAHDGSIAEQISVIIIANFVAFVQGSVAYANHTQKSNFVTKVIGKFSLYA